MKRVFVIVIGSIIVLSIILISIVINNDKRYINKLKSNIINNTEIKSIKYINKYDDYYIVMDNKKLYLITGSYNTLLEVDRILIHENNKNYDIIYKDERLMYFSDLCKKNKLKYRYYDLYTYELIDEVVI